MREGGSMEVILRMDGSVRTRFDPLRGGFVIAEGEGWLVREWGVEAEIVGILVPGRRDWVIKVRLLSTFES